MEKESDFRLSLRRSTYRSPAGNFEGVELKCLISGLNSHYMLVMSAHVSVQQRLIGV